MEFNFTVEELETLKKQLAPNASDGEFKLFLRECEQRNAIPGRHIYFQYRKVRTWDPDLRGYVITQRPFYHAGIDFFRLIAKRSSVYGGPVSIAYIYLDAAGSPNIRSTVPFPDDKGGVKQPWAVEVIVKNKTFDQPITVVARFDAYAVRLEDGELSDIWKTRGPEQLAKCGEALALRQGFPEELGGVYLQEEIKDAEETPPKHKKLEKPPEVKDVPPVNQTPAEPTSIPRPGLKKRGRPPKKIEEIDLKPPEEKPVTITDEDIALPPAADEASIPASSVERGGFHAQLKEIVKKYDLEPDLVLDFSQYFTGKSDPRDFTVRDWAEMLEKLTKVGELGRPALISLLSEVKPKGE